METNKNYDVIVIGAGIIGLCVAYYLAIRGVKVGVIEKNFINSGTSGACDGNVIVGSRSFGIDTKLGIGSLGEYKILNRCLSIDFEFMQRGSLLLIDEENQLELAMDLILRQKEAGLDMEYFTNEEVRKNIAPISKKLFGAVFSKNDSSINPLYFTNSIREKIADNNSRIFFWEEVKEINRTKEHFFMIRTNSTNYLSKVLVNCAGIFSPNIAEMLGEKIPICAARGHIIVTEKNTLKVPMKMMDFSDFYNHSLNRDNHSGIYFVIEPSPSGNFLIGKSEEMGNSENKVSAHILKKIADNAIKFIPKLADVKAIRSYTGFRPHCCDGKPIIGESIVNKNFYHASGHGGGGIGLAPITGKIISQLIIDEKTEYSINDFSPSRFLEEQRIYFYR